MSQSARLTISSALTLLLGVSACVEAPAPVQNATLEAQAKAPNVGLDRNGLRIIEQMTGSSRLIPFGTPSAEVVERLGAALVQVEPPQLGTCGDAQTQVEMAAVDAGAMLIFKDDRFAGWGAYGETLLVTAEGIGVGSPRAQIAQHQAQISQTRYGTQFTIGQPELGFGGVLQSNAPDARVGMLWSGFPCPTSLAEVEAQPAETR